MLLLFSFLSLCATYVREFLWLQASWYEEMVWKMGCINRFLRECSLLRCQHIMFWKDMEINVSQIYYIYCTKLQNNLHLWITKSNLQIRVRPHPFVCHCTITSIQLSLPSSQHTLPSIQVKRLINCAYFALNMFGSQSITVS